jgi:hypothetical protein
MHAVSVLKKQKNCVVPRWGGGQQGHDVGIEAEEESYIL